MPQMKIGWYEVKLEEVVKRLDKEIEDGKLDHLFTKAKGIRSRQAMVILTYLIQENMYLHKRIDELMVALQPSKPNS